MHDSRIWVASLADRHAGVRIVVIWLASVTALLAASMGAWDVPVPMLILAGGVAVSLARSRAGTIRLGDDAVQVDLGSRVVRLARDDLGFDRCVWAPAGSTAVGAAAVIHDGDSVVVLGGRGCRGRDAARVVDAVDLWLEAAAFEALTAELAQLAPADPVAYRTQAPQASCCVVAAARGSGAARAAGYVVFAPFLLVTPVLYGVVGGSWEPALLAVGLIALLIGLALVGEPGRRGPSITIRVRGGRVCVTDGAREISDSRGRVRVTAGTCRGGKHVGAALQLEFRDGSRWLIAAWPQAPAWDDADPWTEAPTHTLPAGDLATLAAALDVPL